MVPEEVRRGKPPRAGRTAQSPRQDWRCLGGGQFFFAKFRKLLESFERLFQAPDEGNAGPVTNPLAGYGWLMVVWRMANKDVLKFEAIFAMKAVEFLNYALLIHDILEAERQEAERMRRR